MSNTINIGGITVSKFYLGGSSDVKIYLGTTKLYPNTDYSNCFKFIAKSSGTFTFTPKTDEASGNVISYSLDSGSTWTSANTTSTVQSGDVVYVKGEDFAIKASGGGIGTFSSTCNFDVEGNVMSLLYGDNFENQTSLSGKNYAFMNLFSGCTTVINAENMELPATTLSDYCYCNMFNGAINLVKAPSELPATTLSVGCYYNMFYSGTSLTTAPELHAATLLQDSYRQMFKYCTNLNKITCLATNISASNCTNNWVANVAARGTFYKASGMTSWTTGNSGIPTSWTKRNYNPYKFNHLTFTALESGTFTFSVNNIDYSLDSGSTWTTLSANTNSPTLESGDTIMWKASGLTPTSSAGIGTFSSTANFTAAGNVMSLLYGDNFEGQTSLAGKDHALRSLFSGCTTLTSIDNMSLPATTLSDSCYRAMFSGCTSITNIENLVLPATTLAENCYTRMFYGCTSLTTVPSDLLPVTTLEENCYDSMFQSCTSLTTVPSDLLPATTLVNRCYINMFNRCTSLTTPPTLPATTLATGCYYNMFYQNSSLRTSPVLPAPTLVQDCYRQMFYNCRNLNTVTCLATTGINTNNSTNNWLSNTSSSGTFYRATGVSWPTGNSGHKTWALVNYSG